MPRKILNRLRLKEISAVTKPAQEPAVMAIMKAAPDGGTVLSPDLQFVKNTLQIAVKMAGVDAEPNADGKALTFADAMAERERREQVEEITEELWPMFWALQDALGAIVSQDGISAAERLSAINLSIRQFADAVSQALPDMKADVAGEYEKADQIFKAAIEAAEQETKTMTLEQALAKIAELEGKVADLSKAVETSEAGSADLAKKLETATAELAEAKKAAEIAKSDETITIEGEVLRKSAVGESVFRIMKAQAERNERLEFAKMAGDLIPNLPGDEATKVSVLKAVHGIADEATRKAALDMLKSGSEGNSQLLKEAGRSGAGNGGATAAEQMDAKAREIAKAEGISEDAALAKFLKTADGRALQAKANEEARAAH